MFVIRDTKDLSSQGCLILSIREDNFCIDYLSWKFLKALLWFALDDPATAFSDLTWP